MCFGKVSSLLNLSSLICNWHIPPMVCVLVINISVADVCGFTLWLGNIVFNIFRGLIELLMGAVFGSLVGILCWFLPNKYEVKYLHTNKMIEKWSQFLLVTCSFLPTVDIPEVFFYWVLMMLDSAWYSQTIIMVIILGNFIFQAMGHFSINNLERENYSFIQTLRRWWLNCSLYVTIYPPMCYTRNLVVC